jgi:transposase
MRKHKTSSNAQACGAQVASKSQPQYQQIKLALDVHAASIVVARMVDGAKPQPPQTFKPAEFLKWAQKQKVLAQEVVSCYEAGPTGFWLHRQLTTLGIRNYVVCPTSLDERHGGVNNDRTDALELATRLDRYLAGNNRALAVVRVPPTASASGEACDGRASGTQFDEPAAAEFCSQGLLFGHA